MAIINITSDRKNVTLDSDVILYIIMHGKIAEIHIVGGRVYETRVALKDLEGLLKEEFVKIHRGCIVSVKAVHDVTDTVNLSHGEELRGIVAASCLTWIRLRQLTVVVMSIEYGIYI